MKSELAIGLWAIDKILKVVEAPELSQEERVARAQSLDTSIEMLILKQNQDYVTATS
jgi:hypothetical protein